MYNKNVNQVYSMCKDKISVRILILGLMAQCTKGKKVMLQISFEKAHTEKKFK